MDSLDKQTNSIKCWKKIWIHKAVLTTYKTRRGPPAFTHRPKKFKNYKKGYLQIEN